MNHRPAGGAASPVGTGETDQLRLVDGRFLDPETGVITEGDLLVRRGRIEALGDVGSTSAPAISIAGKTVIPGLIDAHFHAYAASLGGLELERGPLSYIALNAARRLAGALARGFTTVRDPAGGDIGLARAIDEGIVSAPRYYFTGPALSQTGGHGDPREPGLDVCFHHGHLSEVVDGVDALRLAARERLRAGAHAIKMMTGGGVGSPADPLRPPQYSAEEIRAVVDEANRRGAYVAAHAYSAESIAHSVTNGVRSIEHGNLLDAPTAQLMKQHQAFLVSTLGAYDALRRRADEVGLSAASRAKNIEVLEAGANSLAIATAVGVPIGFGSDNMGDLVDEQLTGIKLHVNAREPIDTLRSLTCINADLLREPDLGRIRIGALADLLVLERDPLDDPAVLWDTESHPRSVVHRGRVLAGSLARTGWSRPLA